MKRLFLLLVLIGIITLCLLQSPVSVTGNGCGIEPLKPIVPLGCRDIYPECVCDQNGNCVWRWVCVK